MTFFKNAISSKDQPIAFFAMEWCEYCWSARKFFKKHDIEYNSIDLDSVRYQEGDMGAKIRAALNAKTGSKTIPQIFIGGKFIGGCTDLFNEYNNGTLQDRLKACGIHFDEGLKVDPYSFLPVWMQPR